jgi:hypothetical protein
MVVRKNRRENFHCGFDDKAMRLGFNVVGSSQFF